MSGKGILSKESHLNWDGKDRRVSQVKCKQDGEEGTNSSTRKDHRPVGRLRVGNNLMWCRTQIKAVLLGCYIENGNWYKEQVKWKKGPNDGSPSCLSSEHAFSLKCGYRTEYLCVAEILKLEKKHSLFLSSLEHRREDKTDKFSQVQARNHRRMKNIRSRGGKIEWGQILFLERNILASIQLYNSFNNNNQKKKVNVLGKSAKALQRYTWKARWIGLS